MPTNIKKDMLEACKEPMEIWIDDIITNGIDSNDDVILNTESSDVFNMFKGWCEINGYSSKYQNTASTIRKLKKMADAKKLFTGTGRALHSKTIRTFILSKSPVE